MTVGRRKALLAVALIGAIGLGGYVALRAATTDDLSAWQATPLAPDPALAMEATTNPACRSRSWFLNATPPPPFTEPMRVILQDRRTAGTAVFIVENDGYIGSCIISRGHLNFGSNLFLRDATWSRNVEGITVDSGGAGSTGNWVWGRSEARIVSIAIDLESGSHVVDEDDRVVHASVDGGYWLGWWPDGGSGTVVTGRDGEGNVVTTMKHYDTVGWVEQ